MALARSGLFLATAYILVLFAHARPSSLANQRLLLLYVDGVRHDYLDQSGLPLPGFQKIISNGARARRFIPNFPSLSLPNYYSIMTGLYTEVHGMTGNYMFDVTRNEAFLLGSNIESANAHWWDGGDPIWTTAVRQNKKVHMWVKGCQVPIRGLLPTACSTTVYTPVDLQDVLSSSLTLLESGDTDVAIVHYEGTDVVGHKYGPLSPEMNQEMSDLDPLMSDLADRLLEPALSNVNLMLFSDHGMTTIDDTKTINVSAALSPDDYIIVLEYCSLASIYTVPGKEDEVYNKLVNYHPHLTVYRKSGLPNKWHYKHGKYVAPITVVADQGWFILTPYLNTYPVRPEDGQPMLGWHGYDNKKRDMHGIFIGMGPAFKSGKTSRPIRAVDLYPVMCDILDIQASPNNGSLAKMKPLLKRHRCDDDDDDDDASDPITPPSSPTTPQA